MSSPNTQLPHHNPAILLVDDEPGFREIVRSFILEALPRARVFEAGTGSEGSIKARNQRFDLIITDMRMPGMDGVTMLQQLATLPPASRPLGCFVISGVVDPLTAAREIGQYTFLSKPLDRGAFQFKLRRYFGLPELQQAGVKQKVDIEFINPFVAATLEVLATMAGVAAKKETVFVRQGDQISGDVSGLVAMNSDAYFGSFAVSFEERCFLGIVSTLLGQSCDSITPEIQDAAGEICNQIFGIAKKVLNEQGHSIQPAIPSVITGRSHSIRHPIGGTCIAVKFTAPQGIFQVEAVLQPKATPSN